MTQPPRSRLVQALLWPLDVLVAVLVIIDEIVRPIYRPLARWIASWRIMAAMESAVAGLPRYAILVLLAIPFAIAEPLKILGLFWIGRGLLLPGLVVTALGHLATFILVERIFHAGRSKLMTIGWFAWLIGLITAVRDAMTAWLKATAAWALVQRARAVAASWLALIRSRTQSRK